MWLKTHLCDYRVSAVRRECRAPTTRLGFVETDEVWDPGYESKKTYDLHPRFKSGRRLQNFLNQT